jgi:hypothetical protein
MAVPSDSSDPIVDPQTLEFRRAITSDEQGYNCTVRLKSDSLERMKKQAAIMRKYNEEPPWDQAKLIAAKQDWRRNTPTGFLSSMVKRIMPPYDSLIDSAKYLTMARFPDQFQEDPKQEQKQDHFRFEVTKCIRSWGGFQPFKRNIILENVLMGYTGGAWTDEFSWKPVFLRQDEAYFPDGCPQEGNKVPLWCHDQAMQIHEMAAYLVNPKVSKIAGWNLENIVDAINNARPENRASGVTAELRKFEDLVRESSLGASYQTGVKIIKMVHLFVQEVNGKVSHYIYNDRGGKLLFKRLDRFETMDQCLALMSIEIGNGKLHGSKGAGRILYNAHVSIDQARNLFLDNIYLSGLLVLKRGENAKPQQALQVMAPLAVIGQGFEVAEEKFEANADAFFQADKFLVQLAELQVGAFMPGQIFSNDGGEKPTASEVNYVASIEQQIREGVLARFYSQFQLIIWQMQKRICSPENIKKAMKLHAKEKSGAIMQLTQGMYSFMQKIGHEITGSFEISKPDRIADDAVQCCLNLLRKGLEPKDIYTLGQQPSFEVTQETARDLSAALLDIKARYANDPSVNQFELTKRDIASKLGNDLADKIIIPQEDNTLVAEATRMQLLELQLLATGEMVNVSPRDNDPVHLQVIKQKAMEIMQDPSVITEDAMPAMQVIIEHADQHLQQGIMKAGGDKQVFAEDAMFIEQARKMLGAASEAQAAAAALQPPPGAMPAAPPPDAAAMPPAGPQPITTNGPAAIQNLPLSRGPIPTNPPVLLP